MVSKVRKQSVVGCWFWVAGYEVALSDRMTSNQQPLTSDLLEGNFP
jgi:hypothetical protein